MLKYCINIFVLIINILYLSNTIAQENNYCGKNLLQGNQSINYFYTKINKYSNENFKLIKSFMSQINISDKDKILISKITENPPFIIRRQPSKYLCQVFLDDGIKAFGVNTPQVEKNLYSADNCVFVSFGSPKGQPIWGDALMTFKEEELSGAWTTPHSGYYYTSLHRFGYTGSNVNINDTVNNLEKSFFKQFIYSDKSKWYELMINNFIMRYKALPENIQDNIYDKLINITDRNIFQTSLSNISIQYKLEYYLEGHMNNFVSLNSLESIQVPSSVESYFESNCPDAYNKWKNIIIFNDDN